MAEELRRAAFEAASRTARAAHEMGERQRLAQNGWDVERGEYLVVYQFELFREESYELHTSRA